ncbi:MAG: hypothetical protein IT161_13950 [Bryobacterales bacterium]|nr:hypothetical protein [Bryobacterales bacterium]MCZ2150028.1 hypothetical protein [Bryobacterales bacterium]
MDSAEYIRRVLDAYRATPGTCGVVRKPDRAFALALHVRGVPLDAVENAFVLAAARRLARPADAPPLGIIRSLAYFGPVIDEVLDSTVAQTYYDYLRHRLSRYSTAQPRP